MRKLWTVAAALPALAAVPALAQNENNDGLYVGAGLGDYSADVDGLDDVDDVDLDLDSDGARKVFGGWRFNRFVAVQAEYTDFGDSSTNLGGFTFTSETDGLTPSVVGTLPIGPVELYGKVGVMFYDVEINGPGGTLIDDSGEDAVIGTGIGFTLFERLNFKAEYERIDIDALDDADAVWISGSWRF